MCRRLPKAISDDVCLFVIDEGLVSGILEIGDWTGWVDECWGELGETHLISTSSSRKLRASGPDDIVTATSFAYS